MKNRPSFYFHRLRRRDYTLNELSRYPELRRVMRAGLDSAKSRGLVICDPNTGRWSLTEKGKDREAWGKLPKELGAEFENPMPNPPLLQNKAQAPTPRPHRVDLRQALQAR
ncbi:hypothetical protein PsAD2_02960 [Pseudovibrio axinellae]|uniref:Uncharacterized protein n=1 Tax=Pseudovibrio axinellae TaxID=989403 RepID=A0A165XE97_9HYPH|nr:hypothetical protein PsAD2_02960 [Pseudovibrio axinellae]SER45881.1 hypothetical protein SAMN05421798_110122 [Pseudovibrio axinellae]